jgi:hypothetical protein
MCDYKTVLTERSVPLKLLKVMNGEKVMLYVLLFQWHEFYYDGCT